MSIDENHINWKNAILKDGTGSFLHLIDDNGWKSAILKQNNIKAIPSNFLLDTNGRVIDKDLRGKEMIVKLNDLFKQHTAVIEK